MENPTGDLTVFYTGFLCWLFVSTPFKVGPSSLAQWLRDREKERALTAEEALAGMSES